MASLRSTARRLKLRTDKQCTEIWAVRTSVLQKIQHYPIPGTRVHVEDGRTRVSGGAALAVGVAALAVKKGGTYLVFQGRDWQWTHEVSRRQSKLARQFADDFNNVAGTAGYGWSAAGR